MRGLRVTQPTLYSGFLGHPIPPVYGVGGVETKTFEILQEGIEDIFWHGNEVLKTGSAWGPAIFSNEKSAGTESRSTS